MKPFFLIPGLIIGFEEHFFELMSNEKQLLTFEEIHSRDKLVLTDAELFEHMRSKQIVVTDSISTPEVIETRDAENDLETFIKLADVNEKYQADVHRKMKYISECIKAGITRGQGRYIAHERHRIAKLIDEETKPPGVSTIQGWWKAWEESQKNPATLINGHALKTRHYSVDDDSELFLQDQIESKYAVITRPKIKTAYKSYCDEIKVENAVRKRHGKKLLRQISYRTFYNRIQHLPQLDLLIAREGVQVARMKLRMIKGHLPADYPLDVVEIDHTPMNLFVIDDKAYLPLGRPWLTAAKDRYTGALLGFSISFQKTGLDSIFNCLQHSLEPHTKAYELWPGKIINPWPCYGLGNYYASDRGRDFISFKYINAILELGANFEHCEKRKGWLKGGIERFFNTLETTFFDAMPGKTFPSLDKRGDYDPKEQAVIRFSTLTFLLYKWAADFHNVGENRGKFNRPIDLWNEGVAKVPPPLVRSIDQLDIILGDENEGVLSHEGIRFRRLNYADHQLHDLLNEIGPGAKLKYYVSRRDLGSIHVLNPLTKRYMSVACTRQDYASGLTFFQHDYIRHEAGKILDQKRAIDTYIDTRAAIADGIAEDLKINKSTNYSRVAQLADVNSNSVLKGEPNSITEVFANQTIKPSKPTADVIPMPAYKRKKLAWG